MKEEVLDVKDKLVIVRSEDEPEDDAMDLISNRLKRLGASLVVFAVGDFSKVEIELLDDAQLKRMGLMRITPLLVNGKDDHKKRRSGKKPIH